MTDENNRLRGFLKNTADPQNVIVQRDIFRARRIFTMTWQVGG